MFKNTASQKVIVFAFDSTTNTPKTGDAANLTAYVSKDFGSVTVLTDTSATEMDATNGKGYYLFDITQTETNADVLLVSAKSSTANIVVVGAPATIFTLPPNFGAASIDSSGRVDVIKVAGTTQTARDLGTSVLISSGTGTGQLSVTSGVIASNVTQFGGSAGTNASGRPEVNVSHWSGTAAAAVDTAGYPKVTIKSGTGTGEISLSGGGVAVRGNIKKNTALTAFPFMMTDSTNHNPVTGKTVTVTRSIDAGAFAAGTLGAVSEVGNGIYAVDFGAGDLNGNDVILRATASSADDTFVHLVTSI